MAPHRLGRIAGLFVLLLALALPLANQFQTHAATDLIIGGDAEVAGAQGDNVNLRSAPSYTSAIVTSVSEGWLVEVVDGPIIDDTDGTIWYQVIGHGRLGYVLADYLRNPVDEAVLAASVLTSTTRVNLRSGPGTDTSVLLVIPADATVDSTGAPQNGFIRVTYSGTTGWSASQYFVGEQTLGPATTTANLNLRTGPATSYAVSLVIPNGSTVSITGPLQSGFYPVQFSGTSGFASATYLQPLSSQTSATTNANLNLRSGPGTSYSVIVVIPNGSEVVVTGEQQGGFYPIVFGNTIGFVSATYLNFGTAPPVTTPAWTTANLNLRSGPSTSASILTVIPEGAQITITGALVDEFYPVRFDGIDGYASANWITTTAPPSPTPVSRIAFTTANLNLRSAANAASNVLTVIPNGSQITVSGDPVDGFYATTWNGTNGYASATYITFEISGTQSSIIWPVSGDTWQILQGYNGSSHQNNDSAWQYLYSLDISRSDLQAAGVQVFAPVSGTVRWYERASGGITIDMGNGYAFAMFHVTVDRHWQPGDQIRQGDLVGTISPPGGEGFQQVPHVHLTLWQTDDGGNWDRHATPFTGQFAISGNSFPADGTAYQWSGFLFEP